jgi:hypothetical protein
VNAQKTTKLLKENKNVLLLSVIIILSLGLLYYVLFVNPQTSQFFGNKPTHTPIIKNYPVLDKALNDVINSSSPNDAAENNLAVEGNTVKALITLKDESFVFTDTYGKEYLRYGKYIQAGVKFDKLEELAQNPKIKSIVAPLKSNRPK